MLSLMVGYKKIQCLKIQCIYQLSKNLLGYGKCCNLIGYATRYLVVNRRVTRDRVTASNGE